MMKLKSVLQASLITLGLASAAQADLSAPMQTAFTADPLVTFKSAADGLGSVVFAPEAQQLANIKPIAGTGLAASAFLNVGFTGHGFGAQQEPFLKSGQVETGLTASWAAVQPIAGVSSYETLAVTQASGSNLWDTTGAAVLLANIKPIADTLSVKMNAQY